MSKGWLLFWAATFIGFSVHDFNAGHIGFATFEMIVGVGIAFNLVIRFLLEVE